MQDVLKAAGVVVREEGETSHWVCAHCGQESRPRGRLAKTIRGAIRHAYTTGHQRKRNLDLHARAVRVDGA